MTRYSTYPNCKQRQMKLDTFAGGVDLIIGPYVKQLGLHFPELPDIPVMTLAHSATPLFMRPFNSNPVTKVLLPGKLSLFL